MSNDSNPDRNRPRRRRTLLIGGIIAVFALGLIAYGLYWFLDGRYYVSTDDAYVAGNRLMLTPQIAGTVVAINADDTDRVTAGQPLIRLDDSNQKVALEHAEAALGEAVRKVEALYQQEDGERATITLRRAKLDQARRDYERDRHLLKIGGVTRQQFQHERTDYHGAQADLRRAQDQLAALEAHTSGASLRETPPVALAISNLRQAWLDLQRTAIPAPVSGYVAQRGVQIGERVAPGKNLLAIVPLHQIWVDANFKETQLAELRLGQPVRLTADQYGSSVVYHGRLVGISAGTGSAFELLPPQNATGNWIKIVRRVPVRIRLQGDALARHPLRIGLSMNVTVDVHDPHGAVLPTRPPTQPVYATDVYRRNSRGLDQLVDAIVRTNRSSPTDGKTS
jgi:Multidrug resistance efflux pump